MHSQASFLEAAAVAFDSLRTSKLRSFLTLLGIILSTTTLIAVMAVIHGTDVYIATSASTMGTEGFRVVRFTFTGGFDPRKFVEMARKNPQLSVEEFEFLKDRLTLVREYGLSAQRTSTVSFGGDQLQGVGLLGNYANGALMTNTEAEAGRYFSEIELRRRAEVAFIGADLKTRFFPATDPLGRVITIDGRPFQVIGVGKPKGSLMGSSQDNYVSIPFSTYIKIYGSRSDLQYNFIAASRERLTSAQEEIRVILRAYRHLKPQQDDTFSMVSSDSLVSTWDQLTGAIAAAAVGIVSLFMVVGGVVIMNIMLAVVTERTREIGVRKSVGARRRDILNQFLVESSTLAATGGLIGVMIAWLAAVIVRNTTPVPMEVPWNAVVIGVGLSAMVGLFFGIYPARRAALLDPIVALRAEN